MSIQKLKNRLLDLNGFTFISFTAKYDVPPSILKKGTKATRERLLQHGIDRTTMFRVVKTNAQLSTTTNGYNEYVNNKFRKAGLPGEFEEWQEEQVEKYGATFNGNYEKVDPNNNALVTKVDPKTGELVEYLVIFGAKNTETTYYYLDQETKVPVEIDINRPIFDDFRPKKSEKYVNYTEYEKLVREVRDSLDFRRPKLKNIIEMKLIGEVIKVSEVSVKDKMIESAKANKDIKNIAKASLSKTLEGVL